MLTVIKGMECWKLRRGAAYGSYAGCHGKKVCMNAKQFGKFVERDKGCLHCGETEAIAPNHRINRGMGGSKLRDNPSNIVVLCSVVNGLIESDAKWRRQAISWGWKLPSWEDSLYAPVYDFQTFTWWSLDDKFGRKEWIEHGDSG